MGDVSDGTPAWLVRKAGPQDLQLIAANNQAMAKETENIDIPDNVAVAGVEAVLTGSAKDAAVYYLIEVEGQVVGQLMITLEWSDWRAAFIWWIQSVYVIPSHRGRGHYKQLYQYVKEDAHRQGAAGLRLYADDSNTNAQATVQQRYKVKLLARLSGEEQKKTKKQSTQA